MNQIGIIGKGGQAREVAGYLKELGASVAFTALTADYVTDDSELDIEQPGDEAAATEVVIAIGSPALKRDMAHKWPGAAYAKILSPKSHTVQPALVGDGSVVAPLSSVGPDTSIGQHVLVNISSSVAHDCSVGDYVTISPGVNIGGNVTIGAGCFIGIGATIKNGVTIASGSVIGAGAVVLADITDENSVAVGIPAKVIKRNEDWLYEI